MTLSLWGRVPAGRERAAQHVLSHSPSPMNGEGS